MISKLAGSDAVGVAFVLGTTLSRPGLGERVESTLAAGVGEPGAGGGPGAGEQPTRTARATTTMTVQRLGSTGQGYFAHDVHGGQ